MNGILFDLDAVYEQHPDDITNSFYKQKLGKLEKIEKNVCTVRNALHFFGYTPIEAAFEDVRDEISADLGGFALVLMSYRDNVNGNYNEEYEDDFVLALVQLFCMDSKLSRDYFLHPTGECRAKLLAKTTYFNYIQFWPKLFILFSGLSKK